MKIKEIINISSKYIKEQNERTKNHLSQCLFAWNNNNNNNNGKKKHTLLTLLKLKIKYKFSITIIVKKDFLVVWWFSNSTEQM